MKYFVAPLLTLAVFAGVVAAETESVNAPLYIYLYARVTDHVNISIAEDQVHHLLPMLEKYAKAYPEAHISATVLFSGAVSDAFAKRNDQTHIVDFVRGYVRRHVIEVGYDGSDEPTYDHRPLLEFSDSSTPADRWRIRHAVAEKFLTEARDPITGAPIPGQSGGLKRMEEVFGDAAAIDGLTLWMPTKSPLMPTGSGAHPHNPLSTAPQPMPAPVSVLQPEVIADSETVQLLPHDSRRPVIFGIPDVNPFHLPGYTGARRQFGKAMSPLPNTSPAIYWQDNILRSSDASGDVVRLVHANQGIEPLKTLIDKADRSRIQVVHVEVASEQNYLQPDFRKPNNYPPLKYAYTHPDSPKLPEQELMTPADVDAAFAKEGEVLAWLTKEFFPADVPSRFISNRDLTRMVEPPTGFTISMEGLRAGYADYLKQAGNDTFLPPLFRAEGHYLSLAELFQVSVDALASLHLNGKLPPSVKVVKVFGPVERYADHGLNEGAVSLESLAKVCADIDPPLRDQRASDIPKNTIPSLETVDGIQVNAAQLVRLMGQAILDPTPGKKYPVRMTYMITMPGQVIPKLRPGPDLGFVWTLKPAVFLPVQEHRLAAP